jgi:hypothetical protein
MCYSHFYQHRPENRLLWASKREGVLPSLKPWSRWSDLNRRPAVYETAALPLSYTGNGPFISQYIPNIVA